MAVKNESKEVALKEDALPAGYDLSQLESDAEQVNPNLGAGDVALPYVYVLQTNSPQVNPAKSEFIAGAQAGMYYNSVTNQVYEGRTEGLIMVPCYYERKLVEWVHRDVGGGWVQDHPVDSNIMEQTKRDDKGKPRLQNGNVIVETAYHYVFFQDPESGLWGQGIIPMASTFLKKNRKWNNLITTSLIPGTEKQAPRFLYAYNLTTEVESKGENSWFVPEMKKIESPIEMSLYNRCKKFALMIKEGAITRAPPIAGVAGDEEVDEETGEVTKKKSVF